MKKVLIVYQNHDNQKVIDFIKNNFEEVFGEYVQFDNCYLCDLAPGTKLNADAYLVREDNKFHKLHEYTSEYSKILKINRSPDRDALNKISKIPANTDVLVVNDSYSSSLDTTYEFFEIGIGHINLIAYDKDVDNTGIYDHIDTAITTAELERVPKRIKNIIDIGYRKVSFDTMFNLMRLLDLDISVINRNLFRHIHSVVESNSAFHDNYIYSQLKSEMLGHIAGSNKVGMILVDKYFQPVYANNKALQIFHCVSKTELNISDYISPSILTDTETPDYPIQIHGYGYYFDKSVISLMDEIAGYYITLQYEQDIDVSNKLNKKKGFFAKYHFNDIAHRSSDMAKIIDTARQIALTDHTVLIRGESGTGKELMAQSIHNASRRNKFPFVAVNCASLPDSLLESELFGYEAGAFTGAQTKGKVGLFELANHGTIFLDEIGDISPKLQARLLRTIQERQIMRVGSDRVIDVDIRLISATNKDLKAAVREGTFRSDLFFRLNVLPILIPPLRERREDIPILLQKILQEEYKNITPEDLSLLVKYDWPGNVRELENAATYYRTLHSFPEFITSQKFAEDIYQKKSDINDYILQTISANTTLSHGIGKSALRKELVGKGVELSDGKLRELLNQLQQKELIFIGKGRFGTRITDKGLAYIQKKAKSGK